MKQKKNITEENEKLKTENWKQSQKGSQCFWSSESVDNCNVKQEPYCMFTRRLWYYSG